MLKIGDVAKKSGVSVRSLRHYDKLGLLKPRGCSESGYRLYSRDDIYRLQQIISLKQMKIPLQKIKSMLIEDSMSLRETLEMQRKYLHQQLVQYRNLCKSVNRLLARLANQADISLELIYKTMEDIKMLEKYYTSAQLHALEQRDFHQYPEKGQEYADAWSELFSGLDKLRRAGIVPTDQQTLSYVIKSRKLVQDFTAGDKGIEQSLNTMYQQEGGAQMLRNHGLDITDELFAYYEAAVDAHTNES